MDLTPKQAAFVREYLVDLNGTQAAIRAGYSPRTANEQAARLLAKASVKKAVNEAKRRRAERVEVKQDEVLRELLRLMKSDIGAAFDKNGRLIPLHKMPEDTRRAISAIEVQQTATGKVVKVKLWSKVDAIKMAGLHLKLFTEKHQMEHSFAELTDEQLEAKKRELLAKAAE